MGTTFKPQYPAAGAAVTITLDGLASSATDGRESALIDNTTDRWSRGTLHAKIKTAAGSPANDKAVYFYAYEETLDGSSTAQKPTPLAAVDAAVAAIQQGSLKYLGAMAVPAGATSYERNFDLAAAFPDGLPRKWGIVVRNYTGLALSATPGDNAVTWYPGVYEAVS